MKDGKRNFTWLLVRGVVSGGRQKSGFRLKQAFRGRGTQTFPQEKAGCCGKPEIFCSAWVSAPSRCSAWSSPHCPKGPGCNDRRDTAAVQLQSAVKGWEGSVPSARLSLFFFKLFISRSKAGKAPNEMGKVPRGAGASCRGTLLCALTASSLPPALEKGSSSPSTGFNHPDSLPAAVPGTPMLQLSLTFPPPNRAGPRHGSPHAQGASLSPRLPSGAATSSPAASLKVTWGGIWVRDELNHTLRAGPRCKGSLDGGPAGSHLLLEIPARGSHIKGSARGCN